MHRKVALILMGFFAAARIGVGAEASTALYMSKVHPIIEENCVKCHGPLQQKSGLELDTFDLLVKGGDDGAVIVPGKPQDSPMYKNLAPDAETHMPPKKQLSDADRQTIRDWIMVVSTNAVAGAAKPRPVRDFDSITKAIDTLIAEGWQERGVKPANPVDDSAWCRRVYLDLAGRICTEEELKAFQDAPADSKRTALVDKLLAGDEYPVHMRELWDVFLMGRSKGGGGGGGGGGGVVDVAAGAAAAAADPRQGSG